MPVPCRHVCRCVRQGPARRSHDEYPPLSYTDEDGQRRGFEYELADSLCRRLGRTCVWTFTTQADLVQGLRDGQF